MDLQPLGDRLIVEALEEEETTSSGIVLPDTAKEKPQRGRVLAAEHRPVGLEIEENGAGDGHPPAFERQEARRGARSGHRQSGIGRAEVEAAMALGQGHGATRDLAGQRF